MCEMNVTIQKVDKILKSTKATQNYDVLEKAYYKAKNEFLDASEVDTDISENIDNLKKSILEHMIEITQSEPCLEWIADEASENGYESIYQMASKKASQILIA